MLGTAKMSELLRRYHRHCVKGGELSEENLSQIIEFSEGSPFVATTVIDVWRNKGPLDLSGVRGGVADKIAKYLYDEFPAELRPALLQAAVLRLLGHDAVRQLVPEEPVDKLFETLHHWKLVEGVQGGGYAFHDLIREGLPRLLLKTHDSSRLADLHSRAAEYYRGQLETASYVNRWRFLFERLYHLVHADEPAGIRLLRDTVRELLRYRDLNRFADLLNDACSYSADISAGDRLWIDFYNARLAWYHRRREEAVKEYARIGDNSDAPSQLRSEALMALGDAWTGTTHLASQGGPSTTRNALEKSLSLSDTNDPYRVHAFSALATIDKYEGKWDAAEKRLLDALEAVKDSLEGDHVVNRYGSLIDLYWTWGKWPQAVVAEQEGIERLRLLNAAPYFLKRFQGWSRYGAVWAGRYRPAEEKLKEAILEYENLETDDVQLVNTLSKDLALALAVQGKCAEANELFADAEEALAKLGPQGQHMHASANGFWGAALSLNGEYDEAESKLEDALAEKMRIGDRLGIEEVLLWLGNVSELRVVNPVGESGFREQLVEAEARYKQCLDPEWPGRLSFKCGALAGLAQLKSRMGEFEAVTEPLGQAEQLAEEFEYDDQLAGIRLAQGHIAWDGSLKNWGTGFDAALTLYREALICALRFNRFLLDEVLSGKPKGSLLRSIIPHCLARGADGLKMLGALRDWWNTGSNEVSKPRTETISVVPQGLQVLVAESKSRENEPGDYSRQAEVVDQLDKAMCEC